MLVKQPSAPSAMKWSRRKAYPSRSRRTAFGTSGAEAQFAEVADAPRGPVAVQSVNTEPPHGVGASRRANDGRSVHRSRQPFAGEVVRLLVKRSRAPRRA